MTAIPYGNDYPASGAWLDHDGTVHGNGDGVAILDRVYDFLGRFVAYPSDAAQIAHALWIAHTHLMDEWETTARIAFLSPEPASGKTRALEVSELLVPNPIIAINMSPSYLFRKVGNDSPTILYDEIDTVFGPAARGNEEIRGLLNAGYRRGAIAGRSRVVGKTVVTEDIPAYCAVALAGLGSLPDTILTRSVIVRMRRRAPGEQVEPFRRRMHEPQGTAIRDELAAWADTISIDGEWPIMPESITDRPADIWEPLIAVADQAGGSWPDRSRRAAVALVAEAMDATPSLGIRLLTDLLTVFDGAEKMTTTDVLAGLWKLELSPWADLNRAPLNARKLSDLLRGYGVRPTTVKINGIGSKGYRATGVTGLGDAWARYLPGYGGHGSNGTLALPGVTTGEADSQDLADAPTRSSEETD
ncbi:DUF3631 domain-containing protein [Amycolatopsis sp. NPDC051128]|uniref:DUF3631 domain-containing protein n=1 Tax=Amycolatopsis sp. NPDC051128 TaxID=3155412 RepID=UPI0034319A29